MNAAPKTPQQVRCIFGLAKQQGIDHDDLHALVEETTRNGDRPGKLSVARLTVAEADAVIVRLGGQPPASRRTIQYRRKQAGVAQIAQPSQLKLMGDLAQRRNMSEEGLAQLAARMRVSFPPRTTADTNKLVEALKAMHKRDAL